MIIKLFLLNGSWMAKHEGDSEIRSLFGTDTLPTPFFAPMAGECVVDEISRLNPTKSVVLA